MSELDPASLEFVKLQGERGELLRLAKEAVQEAEEAAKKRRGKHRRLPYALSQLRAYVAILEERDRPDLERIDALLKKYSQPEGVKE